MRINLSGLMVNLLTPERGKFVPQFILKIEYKIVCLKLKIRFLKPRIKFDRFIEKREKIKFISTFILIFGYSKT